MIQLTRKQRGAFVSGEMNVKDLAQDFLATYPITEIAESLAEVLTAPVAYTEPKPIAITQEDYDKIMKLFRVKGFDVAGEVVKRGRPKKGEGQVKCN